jgi:hypothetical protein
MGFRSVGFPPACHSGYGASDCYPGGTDSRWTHQPFLDARRVEGWRAHGRVRWPFHGFRRRPQSGSPGHVSNPRHVERSRRISRTPLSCPLHAKAYATHRSGSALGSGTWPLLTPPGPLGAAFLLAYIPRLRSCRSMGVFFMAPLPPILPEESQAAGPLRSTGVTPLRRYCGPIRHPLAVSRLPGATGYTAYPASADFAAGRGGLLQLLAVPLSPCCR